MPVPKTTKLELKKHLAQLGLQKGDNIAVHSRLISFGVLEGAEQTVLDALTETVGETASIAVPAYTFNITKDDVFDPASTPSYQVGAFSEFFRKLPGVVRSARPIHSHALRGPLADSFLELKGNASFGEASDFDFFLKKNFKLVLLGCKFSEGATYLHHLEAVAKVPYRSWLSLNRNMRINEKLQTVQAPYFSRIAESPVTEDFDKAMKDINNLLTVAPCPFGKSYAIPLTTLNDFVLKKLKDDPYYLVKV